MIGGRFHRWFERCSKMPILTDVTPQPEPSDGFGVLAGPPLSR